MANFRYEVYWTHLNTDQMGIFRILHDKSLSVKYTIVNIFQK